LSTDGEGSADDFDPDPARCVWITGEINQSLEDRVRPRILGLISNSRAPITLCIDSHGGTPAVAHRILGLLRATAQGDAAPCRLIAIAGAKALSVAADLLCAADFAIAQPHSRLLFHGTRIRSQEPVTAKSATMLADGLKSSNHNFANLLLERSAARLTFIFKVLRTSFAEPRADVGDDSLGDIQRFQRILHTKVSAAGEEILDRANSLWDRHNGLLVQFGKKLRRGRTVTRGQLQKLMLNSAIAFDYESNPAWDGDLTRIGDDYRILNSYFDFGALRDYVAARAVPQPASTDAEADYFLQLRVFSLALCRALQEGENYITPLDSLFLGLVDTVRSDLATFYAETVSGSGASCLAREREA
jgi:ATP-dependent protease ClpP protease subunit